jgi:hypothetical protein
MISNDDYFWFVDRSLDGMVDIVTELGDELANARLPVPGANSPYVVLTHCLGVIEYWGGHVIAGRNISRDRAAEFTASGSVDDLVRRTRRAREQFAADLRSLDPAAPARGEPLYPDDADLPLARTQGGAAVHVYEELAQHFGQMEVTRDLLLEAGR